MLDFFLPMHVKVKALCQQCGVSALIIIDDSPVERNTNTEILLLKGKIPWNPKLNSAPDHL